MIFATPFHPSLTDFADYAKVLKRRGPLLSHIHLVVTTEAHQDEAYDFGEITSDLFLRSVHVVLPKLDRTRNATANDMFRSALRFATRYEAKPNELADPALLYSDPSYRPAKTGWLNTIQSEYYLRGAPTVMAATEEYSDGLPLIRGPVIFSKDFPKKSGLLDFVPPTVHWRLHLRWEMARDFAETKLFGRHADSVLRQPATPKV